ncbi:fibronectin type III-like domain-contianing protein [Novosphingobium pentaromativorans]|uniref:Glycoside hydrolase, family 3-like protein n=1 Tax=Novosphingobium pentaromativorans US6-1 TaxID=1088721 RepID=G6EHC5_9SPHN|nr:fibronectin type III-like domain-contianing protein [Novosphingobium pentaromativorans]AIT81914.1 hypothetical protein JI59_20305 [Novosphingobium pentaromativorans US6-1]EHJ59414.1 glycoside hydrolase, family 3-like protein [Novosphingobium pentaromativorans US6-1]
MFGATIAAFMGIASSATTAFAEISETEIRTRAEARVLRTPAHLDASRSSPEPPGRQKELLEAVIAPGGKVTVTFDLKNTGTRTADEVAQLYIHQAVGTASRPVRELKSYQRVTLGPGETRRHSFEPGPKKRQYWNAATRARVIDESTFEVAVGGDSTADFEASFVVDRSGAAQTEGNFR